LNRRKQHDVSPCITKFFVPHEIEAYLVLGNLVDVISPLGQQLFLIGNTA
jgi:hypothetical protein